MGADELDFSRVPNNLYILISAHAAISINTQTQLSQ